MRHAPCKGRLSMESDMQNIDSAISEVFRLECESLCYPRCFVAKCRKEALINVEQQNIFVIKEPDAKTQSR